MAAPGGRELPETPTWAVALVVLVLVLISVALEHALHKLTHVRAHHTTPAPLRSMIIMGASDSACVCNRSNLRCSWQWFHKRHKKALAEALEKMKAELMLVGFISLLLTVFQDLISKICISEKAGSVMLPCKGYAAYAGGGDDYGEKGGRRRLLSYLAADSHGRFLAAAPAEDVCAKQVSLPRSVWTNL
jgi:mlo protein